MMNFTLRYIMLFILLSLINGCGFHLRGVQPLTPSFKELYLKTPDPYGSLTHHLQQMLKLSGVHLVANPTDASTILIILNEEKTQQLLSVGGTQETRQYNVGLNVTFEVQDSHHRILMPSQTLTETRPITLRSNQILAGSNEINSLYEQMRQSMAYDIIIRLSAADASQASTHTPKATP